MSNPHILIVDDEPDIRDLLREILEDERFEVSTAGSVQEARMAWRSHRPDLVLLDIWMPDGDGISLLKEWSDDQPLDVPVVMISGHGSVETAVEATRLGAYDFLEKPLSMGKLVVPGEHRPAPPHRRLGTAGQEPRNSTNQGPHRPYRSPQDHRFLKR